VNAYASLSSYSDCESAVRTISRAVIHRVCQEHLDTPRHQLFVYVANANPFRNTSEDVEHVWFEEVFSTIGDELEEI
jgi:hypothetical protein